MFCIFVFLLFVMEKTKEEKTEAVREEEKFTLFCLVFLLS
jgi:hypothetical protein